MPVPHPTVTPKPLPAWAGVVAIALMAAGSAALGAENFAKFRAATASAFNGSYEPSFATDGLVSNFHSHRVATTTDPVWVQVTFPKPLKIGSAHVYLGLDNNPSRGLSSFKFQLRNNNGNWVDVPGTAVSGNTATELVVPFPSAPTADCFRLYSDADGSPVIREIALYPPNLVNSIDVGYPLGTDVTLSLARQRPATASSINSTNYPKNAVDGYVDNSARWLSAGSAAGDYLEIDLLASHVIASAHIYSGWDNTNAITDFDFRYWDGAAWQLVPGTTVTGNTNNALVLSFPNITTSKVRLRTATASTARIKELLIFPPRAGGYPLGQDVRLESPPSAKWNDYSDSSWRLRNSGPDLRLGLVDGEVRFLNNSSLRELIEWQLLLNHRDGSYRVRHPATGLFLSQPAPDSAAGDPVIVEAYGGMPWQDWKLQPTTGNEVQLLNVWSGLALRSRNGIWAADNPIDLAAPDSGALQRWTPNLSRHFFKKGLAGYGYQYGLFNASWFYQWSRGTTTYSPFDVAFNPMQWGGGNLQHGDAQGPLDLIRGDLQISDEPTYLMGFNEPDKTDQANMTVAAATDRWPRLEAMDAPLIAPAPASAFGGWLSDFHADANARGFRRDYYAVHWYSAPNADSLISHLQSVNTTFGRPVWLTEFSTVRWSGTATWTDADNYNFLAEFMWRAESLSWLKRYSIFQFTEGADTGTDPAAAPRSNVRKSGGGLTPFGELYASWDGVTQVLPNKAYHLHNRGEYERAANTGAATPDLVTPAGTAPSSQWFLVPAATAGRHRILSITDGKPLRFVDGGSVSLGTTGQSDASVEWLLVENEYGWFFLQHPQSNKRLKVNGDSTFSMVSASNTGEPIQWRFIVPTNPGDAAPPVAPASLTATSGSGSIQLAWPAATGASSYKVLRSPTTGGPYTQVASGLAATSWTDSGLPTEATRSYVVVATDVTGLESGNSPEATATTLHPFATYAGWSATAFLSMPGASTAASDDPDLDDQDNLLEYAFLSDPVRPGGANLKISRNPAGQIVIDFPWNWRAGSLTWELRHGADLANTAAWPVAATTTVQSVRYGDVDRLTIQPVAPLAGRGFFLLDVRSN